MSAPVDVLAVLNKPVNAGFAELVEARAAVAELLEAIAAERVLYASKCRFAEYQAARARTNAALARCKGAQA